MKGTNDERLLRLLQGILTPEEHAQAQRDLDGSPELRARLDELQALQGVLRSTTQASAEHALKPFFTDRLMRRLAPAAQRLAAPAPDEEFFGLLWRLFRPVALACLLIVLAFASYNVARSSAYVAEPSTAEAVLALPPVTLSTAYDLDLPTTPPTDP